MLSAYNSEIARRNLRGYVVLGAISPDDAAAMAMPKSSIRSSAGFTQNVYDGIVDAAQSGLFHGFNPSGCQGVSAGGDIKIAQQASGLALTGVSMGLVASGVITAAALAPFTMGISAIIGLFPLFFGHHGAAVAKEQRVLCASVPAAQNYLQQIQAAVQGGLASPQQGIAALNSLLSDFKSQVSSILKMDSSHCNAACTWVKQLTAIVAYQTSIYQDFAAAGSSVSSATSGNARTSALAVNSGSTLVLPPSTPAASSSPSWLPIAAVIALGFLATKVL